MRKRILRVDPLVFWILFAFAGVQWAEAQQVQVPSAQKKYFVVSVDRRSIPERALNLLGMSSQEVGRSFALVAGVSYYPNLPSGERNLTAAKADIVNLVAYLRDFEFFDEIVVLENDAVTLENFQYFLQVYFPDRLKAFPRSRFLFAYSGHGMQEGGRGYLIQSSARSLTDKEHSISMEALRAIYGEVVDRAYQSLALINACHSGAFGRSSFGYQQVIPREPGAHVITAGGAKERAWHIEALGPGSVFFEKVFAGLAGQADVFPEHPDGSRGDGVITVPELYSYLVDQVKLATDQSQNPVLSDLSPAGSLGSFFFLNRGRQKVFGFVGDWKAKRKSMGDDFDSSPSDASEVSPPALMPRTAKSAEGIASTATSEAGEVPSSSLFPEIPQREKSEPLHSNDLQVVNSELQRRGFTPDIYFDRNESTLSDWAREYVARNVILLKAFSYFDVTIEGHGSEEGTPEVNLVIGERRANAVKSFMASLGIEESRLRTISYGAERPICTEQGYSCASQNRRVHLVITGTRSGDAGLDFSYKVVNFFSTSAVLLSSEKTELDDVVRKMRSDPDMVVNVIMPEWPNDAGSRHLDEQRAQIVRSYLIVRSGLSPDRVLTEGWKSNKLAEGIRKNRKFIVIECHFLVGLWG